MMNYLIFTFLFQYKPPENSPAINPKGPVTRIPSKGLRFDDGVRIRGPKKPKEKPIIPTNIPPPNINAGRLFEKLSICFHRMMPSSTAIDNDV
jgi:hypothetical protein